jgi:hypothetical protein
VDAARRGHQKIVCDFEEGDHLQDALFRRGGMASSTGTQLEATGTLGAECPSFQKPRLHRASRHTQGLRRFRES